jgi:hypothetical protein
MEIEYIDDEEVTNGIVGKEFQVYDENGQNMHITDTSRYDTTKFDVISPEEIDKENILEEINNPNPGFTNAVKRLGDILDRNLTEEEFLKVADTYATILAERDEENRANYEGKYEINPIKKDLYLGMLLNREPIENAFKKTMKKYEDQMIMPIVNAVENARKNEAKVIEIDLKRKKRINIRYKGKCRIASDEDGKVIIIDNKNDVNLLRMKHRKEWIDKRYNTSVPESSIRPDDDDEFV